MKEHANGLSSKKARGVSQEIGLALLTGRVLQFIQDISENAGVPSTMLAERVRVFLGDSEGGQPSGAEEEVSTLRRNSPKVRSGSRKVEVGRRTRRKLSPAKVRRIAAGLKEGLSINRVAKKNHVAWKTAKEIAEGGDIAA